MRTGPELAKTRIVAEHLYEVLFTAVDGLLCASNCLERDGAE